MVFVARSVRFSDPVRPNRNTVDVSSSSSLMNVAAQGESYRVFRRTNHVTPATATGAF